MRAAPNVPFAIPIPFPRLWSPGRCSTKRHGSHKSMAAPNHRTELFYRAELCGRRCGAVCRGYHFAREPVSVQHERPVRHRCGQLVLRHARCMGGQGCERYRATLPLGPVRPSPPLIGTAPPAVLPGGAPGMETDVTCVHSLQVPLPHGRARSKLLAGRRVPGPRRRGDGVRTPVVDCIVIIRLALVGGYGESAAADRYNSLSGGVCDAGLTCRQSSALGTTTSGSTK